MMSRAAPKTSRAAPGIRYDPRTRQYVDARGIFLPRRRVEEAIAAQAEASGARMNAGGVALRERRISRAQFQLVMEEEIRNLVTAQAAIGAGGFAQLSQADALWIGRQVKFHLQKFEKFKRDIASGRYGKGGDLDGRFLARVEMYAKAGRGVEQAMRRRLAGIAGASEERRVRQKGDSCRTRGRLKGCRELSALGWRPIGTLPAVGQAPCHGNCRCLFEHR
jgi:hypothetical protein